MQNFRQNLSCDTLSIEAFEEDKRLKTEYEIVELRHQLEVFRQASSEGKPEEPLPSKPAERTVVEDMRNEIDYLRANLEHKEDQIRRLIRANEELERRHEDRRSYEGAYDQHHYEMHRKKFGEELNSLERSYDALRKDYESSIVERNKEFEAGRSVLRQAQEKYDAHIQILEKDIKRLRKERDSSREMYEQLNQQISSIQKASDHTKEALNSLAAENMQLRQGKKPESEELAALYEAFEVIERNYGAMASQLSEKDTQLAALKTDKLKAEFEGAQSARQSELALSKMKADRTAEEIFLNELQSRESRARTKLQEAELKILSLSSELNMAQKSALDTRQRNESLKAQLQDFMAKVHI
jgi:chromosome segregation ATPase